MADAVVVGRAALQNKQAMKWQRECAEISRQKAKSQWWLGVRRRARTIIACAGAVYMVGAGYWVWRSGHIESTYDATIEWLYSLSRSVGFELETIRIEGINSLSVPYVVQALGVEVGDPILHYSIKDIKARIDALPEVRASKVERQLPDTLYIEITERKASALWQHKGDYKLIDLDGTVLLNQERDLNTRYVVMTGDDAPLHAQAFLDMIEKTPELKQRVDAATRIGDRRWDVTMHGGIIVKLPETNPEKAWEKFAKLEQDQQLLERAIQSIDMRIEDRLYLKMDAAEPSAEKPKKTTARDI